MKISIVIFCFKQFFVKTSASLGVFKKCEKKLPISPLQLYMKDVQTIIEHLLHHNYVNLVELCSKFFFLCRHVEKLFFLKVVESF